MLPQLFPKRILDDLGPLGGVTGARSVRAEDDLSYVAKDEAPGVPSVRASEAFWLSVAHAIGIPSPQPEVLEDLAGRQLVATRQEFAVVGANAATNQMLLLNGTIADGRRQLSRIYAFDLFAANWDRNLGNYLVLNSNGRFSVFAIDFSHVVLIPDLASRDPAGIAPCATRAAFPVIIAPYGADAGEAVATVDRLVALPTEAIRTILTSIPEAWLAPICKSAVLTWWAGPARVARANLIRQGLQNGSYL